MPGIFWSKILGSCIFLGLHYEAPSDAPTPHPPSCILRVPPPLGYMAKEIVVKILYCVVGLSNIDGTHFN